MAEQAADYAQLLRELQRGRRTAFRADYERHPAWRASALQQSGLVCPCTERGFEEIVAFLLECAGVGDDVEAAMLDAAVQELVCAWEARVDYSAIAPVLRRHWQGRGVIHRGQLERCITRDPLLQRIWGAYYSFIDHWGQDSTFEAVRGAVVAMWNDGRGTDRLTLWRSWLFRLAATHPTARTLLTVAP